MEKQLTRRQLIQGSSAVLLFSVIPTAWANSRPQFVAVRTWPANAYSRITLETTAPLDYKSFELSNPRRLVIDIKNVTLDSVLQSLSSKIKPEDPYISGIRLGNNPAANAVRVVVDLKAPIKPNIFTLKPVDNIQHRLVIDLYPTQAAVDDNDPIYDLLVQYSKGNISSQGTGKTTPPVVKQQPVIISGNSSGTTYTPPPSYTNTKRQPIVVLDPGHGGEDPGAISPSGLREKDVVLSIARETKKLMEAQGYKVYMTRNEDVFIPLGVRVAKARQLHADIFISIHADSFTNPTARGTGVYMLSTSGASSAAAKFLAQTQNNSDLIGGVKVVADKTTNSAILDMTQTVTNNDSKILAEKVLAELGRYNKLHKGRVDSANFAVLRAPDIPSILVETAFLSNPDEEKLLASMNFRKQCAKAITAGAKAYFAKAVLSRR